MYYAALVLSKSALKDDKYEPLYEEMLILIEARTKEEAMEKATSVANKTHCSYLNIDKEEVTWSFEKLVDVTEISDSPPQDGSELYSRHFRNYKAYEDFEVLLNK